MSTEFIEIPEDLILFKRFRYNNKIFILFLRPVEDEDPEMFCFEQIGKNFRVPLEEDYLEIYDYIMTAYCGHELYNTNIDYSKFYELLPVRD